jgi:hypothetical protein
MFIVKETARNLLAYKARNNHYKFKPERRGSDSTVYRPLRKSYQEEDRLYRKAKYKNRGPRYLGNLKQYSNYIRLKKHHRACNDGFYCYFMSISGPKRIATEACKRMRAL